jgi:hypothetical protein
MTTSYKPTTTENLSTLACRTGIEPHPFTRPIGVFMAHAATMAGIRIRFDPNFGRDALADRVGERSDYWFIGPADAELIAEECAIGVEFLAKQKVVMNACRRLGPHVSEKLIRLIKEAAVSAGV